MGQKPASYLKGRVDTTPDGAVLLFLGSRHPAHLQPVEARRIAHLLTEGATEAEFRRVEHEREDGGQSE